MYSQIAAQNAVVPMHTGSSSTDHVPVFKRCPTEPAQINNSKLSEQLLRAAFGQTSPSGATGKYLHNSNQLK